MRLLTNNPRKIVGIEGYGLEIVGREALEFDANQVNEKYLKTKRDKLGHFILGESLMPSYSASSYKITIVISKFNEMITDLLLEGAKKAFLNAGGKESNISLYTVPGAFEIPATVKQVLDNNKPHAIVTWVLLFVGEPLILIMWLENVHEG